MRVLRKYGIYAIACALAAGALQAVGAEQRSFQAVIVSVDPVQKGIRVRHKPTGYETDVIWSEKTVFRANIKYDIDDLAEGWVECYAGAADYKEKQLSKLSILRAVPPSVDPQLRKQEVRTNALFLAKLIRKPFDVATLKDDSFLLTQKRDAIYQVDVGGERWYLTSKHGVHPRLSHDVAWTPAQLKPGMSCREVSYQEGLGHNRLVSLFVLPNQSFSPPMPVGGPTGTTEARIQQEMERLRAAYSKVAKEVRRTAPVSLKVRPEVTLKGEPVTLSLEAWATKVPNAAVTLTAEYLREQARVSSLQLVWKACETTDGLTRYVAQAELPDLPVGQHLVSWACDIGGDVKEYWRSIAVTDPKTLVVMLHFTSGQPNTEFETFKLPHDCWMEVPLMMLGGPFGDRTTPVAASQWREKSRLYRQCGQSPNFFIIQGNYAGRKGWPAPIPVQFMMETESVQRSVLKAAVEIGQMMGFDPRDVGFAAYEFGTRTVNIAREEGIRLIGSLCIHQNWQDGSWGINHTARPLRPYFASTDDFRKPGKGGADGLVMVSQHDKSLLWTEYGLGVFEPAWLEKAWVGGGGGGRSVFDEVFMSRHFDLLNASIENTKNQTVPYFQSIGIEFSKNDPEEMLTKSNALMIRYAVERAREGKVVFAHQAAAAEFYRKHYRETPETVFYDADFWCGMKANNSITDSWKPTDYPDLMHIENSRYSAYFKKPMALPEYHWDYTKPWNYPDWGNEALPRNQVHVLVPGEHNKFSVTPRITDTRKMHVECNVIVNTAEGTTECRVRLQAPEAIRALPLALWDIPCAYAPTPGWVKTEGATRFVPVVAPYTGNLNGILEVDAQPGANEYVVTIRSAARAPVSQDILLDALHAKVFSRDGESLAYIWPARPWETSFEIDIPAGKDVHYYAAPKGERVDLKSGRQRLTLPKESWARIIGLTREELSAALGSTRAD